MIYQGRMIRLPFKRGRSARARRFVAANYTHRFAACDTSCFYPNATATETPGNPIDKKITTIA